MTEVEGGAKLGAWSPQDIRKEVKAEPFIPFRLHVSDGTHYDVNDPADIIVDLMQIAVGIEPDDSGLPKRSMRIAPDHVSRIEPLLKPSAAGNGRTARP